MNDEQKTLLEKLSPGFFTQFTGRKAFHNFINALFKKEVEILLKKEPDAHLSYVRHHKTMSAENSKK